MTHLNFISLKHTNLTNIFSGSRCAVGDRCSNKHFQKHEYAKCDVFKTEKKGFGLRTLDDLPA